MKNLKDLQERILGRVFGISGDVDPVGELHRALDSEITYYHDRISESAGTAVDDVKKAIRHIDDQNLPEDVVITDAIRDAVEKAKSSLSDEEYSYAIESYLDPTALTTKNELSVKPN